MTTVFSLKGKNLNAWGTPNSFSFSPKGTRACVELENGEYLVRPFEKMPKSPVKFEASDVVFADEETLVAAVWKSMDEDVLHRVDAKTGKMKKLGIVPKVSALDAHGDWAIATNVQGKKVLVTWIHLKTGKTEKFELFGSPSGTAVSIGPNGAYVAVNWQKLLHVFTHATATKKAAAPALPLESKPAKDFVRYEMAQKFWAVRLEGDKFTVRFGKQGTDGQEQVKSFANSASALKEHDKLVASKVKKGYRAV